MAEQEGIVDQQGSALEAMSEATDAGVTAGGRRSGRGLAEAFVRMPNEHEPAQVAGQLWSHSFKTGDRPRS